MSQACSVDGSSLTSYRSAHLAGMSGATNPALFSIPTEGKGIIIFDGGSIAWTFFSDSSSSSDLSLCTSSDACGATFSPVCVELVPNGLSPSACAVVAPVTRGTDKWLYATHVIGAKKGWIGINSDSKALEWAVEEVSGQVSLLYPHPAR